MDKKSPLISIVVPAFIEDLYKQIDEIKYQFEVIVVDDGSRDSTLEIIKMLAKKYGNLRCISFTRNFGHQIALMAGISYSKGAAIIMMDADMQHPSSLVPEFLKEWEAGAKVVQAIMTSADIPIFKKITSKLFYFFINIISETKLSNSAADFRLIDREVAEQIMKFNEADIFLRGIIPWLGFKTSFINFKALKRAEGSSKYSLARMIKFAISGIASFSTLPLRLTILSGVAIAMLSFALGVQSLYVRIFTNRAIPGWTSLMIGVFFIGGLIMIFLGIIGEYIGKIFVQVNFSELFLYRFRYLMFGCYEW